jgi:hypothetical protein
MKKSLLKEHGIIFMKIAAVSQRNQPAWLTVTAPNGQAWFTSDSVASCETVV